MLTGKFGARGLSQIDHRQPIRVRFARWKRFEKFRENAIRQFEISFQKELVVISKPLTKARTVLGLPDRVQFKSGAHALRPVMLCF
jgi:hypothetical protein